MGARVIAIDVAPERRKLAQAFGAHEVIDPTSTDMVTAIRDLTHGEGAHKTLDASSAPDARAAAVRSVRSWGTACFVGERGQVTLDVDMTSAVKGDDAVGTPRVVGLSFHGGCSSHRKRRSL